MRFVIGLIFGASLTLLAATAYTGRLPFDLKAGMHAAAAEIATPRPPAARQSSPANLPPAAQAAANQPTVDIAETTRQPTPVAAALPTPQPTDPVVTDTGGRQAVWTPFHSEASARGFAGRLTSQLDHPFRVERLAPQTYVVTFDYRNEPERRAIETRLHALTGTGAS